MTLTFGSVFAGIGGLDLGLERAGMVCKWQVENDPYASAVLAKHWPDVKRYGDVRTVAGDKLERVELICGGFPCQDVSLAGERAGIDGERSGLVFELLRLVRLVRPRFVLLENVPGLAAGDGLLRVLTELTGIGLHAEWSVVSSCSLGATHMRRRLFILAYSNGIFGWPRFWDPASRPKWKVQALDSFESSRAGTRARMADPSALYGGADGVPFGMDRVRCVGNSVDPAVAEAIGRMILDAAARQDRGDG